MWRAYESSRIGNRDDIRPQALTALFSGAWKLTKFEIKGADSSWVEATPPSLLTQYTYTFEQNGTVILSSDGVQAGKDSFTIYDNYQSMDWGINTYHISVLNSNELQLIDSNENFPYSVNGKTATYYGERDTYTY